MLCYPFNYSNSLNKASVAENRDLLVIRIVLLRCPWEGEMRAAMMGHRPRRGEEEQGRGEEEEEGAVVSGYLIIVV